jgi:regulator of RNase E activity RraA
VAPEIPDWLASTVASDAASGVGVLAGAIRALMPEVTIVGRALVVTVSTDDNLAMRDVPSAVRAPGTVLVVAGAEMSRTAILGDLVARELLQAGVIAVVTDGLIRDSRTVAGLGLPVWARGTTAIASRKDGPGGVGGTVTIGGVEVHDDDLVVADADGVVVWPSAQVEALLEKAAAKQRADEERLARLSGR